MGLSFSPMSAATTPAHLPATLVLPEWVNRFAVPGLRGALVLGLAALYLLGGFARMLDIGFAGGAARHVGLAPAVLLSVAEVVLELAALAMLLLGIRRWLGALLLATFTLVAAYTAHRVAGSVVLPTRILGNGGLGPQIALALGFVLLALEDLRSGGDD